MSPLHAHEYKNKQSFRTAFTHHLNALKRDNLLEQVGDQWGLPKADFQATTLLSGLSKQKLKEQFLKALGDVAAERIAGNVYEAERRLDALLGLAPPEWRKPMIPIWNEAHTRFTEETKWVTHFSLVYMQKVGKLVRFLEQKLASIIYEN